MAMKDFIQNSQVEDLRLDGENRLVSNQGWVLFGKEKYGANKGNPFITLMDTTDGYGTEYSFQKDDYAMWRVTKSSRDGHEEKEVCISDMQNGLDALKNLGMNVGPLMQRAICGIAIQHDNAIRIGESLMTTAMRRAGLSVSKDGKLQDAHSVTPNTRGGRS